ncbi:PEP-CTERM sorting domain-containing protein [Bythopirellula goksoeyrii]|uniref:Ice-binding protein C-terminal domain-containing protein n=1 Tax=Bythopirellula goksoeyrii TaxID=1400387 RepID=A0A5B9Q4A9_9BACT|nr:PEP-CTERM sorting domain-containing protein [Bythopirellula goksoeyrii]QEG33854.1 hypothetical protein Pr1d_11240 [Bythopirellula goksoeyrii]
MLSVAGSCCAASISVDSTKTSTGIAYSLTLDAGAPEQFNNIFIEVTAIGSTELRNPAQFTFDSGVGGEDRTYINSTLVTPPFQGGLGWSPVGAESTGSILTARMGPLGAFIDTSASLFLANVSLPDCGGIEYLITLNNTGDEVFRAEGVSPLTPHDCIPEPSTMALAGLSMIGLVLRRRNG